MTATTTSNDLIRASWALVTPQAAAFAETFYGRLFTLDPQLQSLFKGDMAAQRGRLVTMLDAAVGLLGQPDQLMPALRSLGRRHGGYGVQDAHYTVVGEALLGTLGNHLGASFTPAVQAAWTEVYGLIARVMMEAGRTAQAVAAPKQPSPPMRQARPVKAPLMRIAAMSAMTMVLACGSAMAAEAAPVGWHPATSARPAVAVVVRVAGIDPNTFIVGHPASPTTRAGHANSEHPAVQVAQGASTKGIDANTFIVQPPVAVTWRDTPSNDDGLRYAHAGSDRS